MVSKDTRLAAIMTHVGTNGLKLKDAIHRLQEQTRRLEEETARIRKPLPPSRSGSARRTMEEILPPVGDNKKF